MGILNITPDSFSDGGKFLDPDRAVEHGLQMLTAGADVLDLGAESSRPGGGVYGTGSNEIEASQEVDRLLPVLCGLRAATDRPISVDTMKAEVAVAALCHGADIINDVGGLDDPTLRRVLADTETRCPVVVMHSRGTRATMQRGIHFDDVVAEVQSDLRDRIARARASGIATERLILDPGIGFGKELSHNLELLGHLDRFSGLGRPLLVGASRKSFINTISPATPDRRLAGSLAALVWARGSAGVGMVRVHDVEETVQFLRVWSAIDSARTAEL